ncbi:MAG: outer membrane beta-barrel protein [Bacteroidales bacterium]|nr:outer membrane beta-barrel protein [Bacteroidales bacterium]
MSDKNYNIDKLFKDYLLGHKAKAPADAWERLHGELHKSGQTRPVWIWRSVAAVLLLLITFSAGYFLSDYQKSGIRQFTSSTPAKQNKPDATATDVDREIISTDEHDEISENLVTTNEINQSAPENVRQTKPENKSIHPEKVPSNQQLTLNNEPVQTDLELEEVSTPVEEEMAVVTSKEQNGNHDETFNAEISPIDPKQIEVQANDVSFPVNKLFEDPAFLQQLLVAEDLYRFEPDNAKSKNSSSNWSIGGRISPLYSYRALSGSGYETTGDPVAQEYFDDVENGILTVAAGISLDYKFSNRWSLGSGMYVSRTGQENNEVLAIAVPGSSGMYKLATSAGTVTINPKKFESVMVEQQASIKDTIPGGYTVSGTFVQNLDYFEVPFIMQYKLTDQRFSIHLKGGLSPGILINNRSYFEDDGVKLQTGVVENINPMILNSLVGFGFEYSISEKVSVNLDPAFKYSLSPVNQDSKLSAHPYSFSWFTGISYKFY